LSIIPFMIRALACALICSFLRSRAQHHLFSVVKTIEASALQAVLQGPPELVRPVHTLLVAQEIETGCSSI
jgi:hypothetical protein